MLYCVFKGTRTTKGASSFDLLKLIPLLDTWIVFEGIHYNCTVVAFLIP